MSHIRTRRGLRCVCAHFLVRASSDEEPLRGSKHLRVASPRRRTSGRVTLLFPKIGRDSARVAPQKSERKKKFLFRERKSRNSHPASHSPFVEVYNRMASGACAMSSSRFAGICSVSGRGGDATAGRAVSRASRSAVTLGSSSTAARGGPPSEPRKALRSSRNADARGNKNRSSSSVSASLAEPGPAPATFQRRPEDVVASNGREVEQYALQCCVKRQMSGLMVPKPSIPKDMLDSAYERCREVTGEYAKTFYLGAPPSPLSLSRVTPPTPRLPPTVFSHPQPRGRGVMSSPHPYARRRSLAIRSVIHSR